MTARETLNFDREWHFHKGDIPIPYAVKAGRTGGYTDCEKPERGFWLEVAYSDQYGSKEMDPKHWKPVTLPHDWAIEGDYIKDHPKGRAHLPIGIGCYRKMFALPAEDEGKKISIRFDGVMRNSTVWVNGHLIGNHPSGHTSFYFDVTDVLRYGDEGMNVVFVKVDASEYEGWWYDGCGIYRHVWLEKTDRLHVKTWGTYITTPIVEAERAEVKMETIVMNEHPSAADCRIVTEILDPQGQKAAVAENRSTIFGDSESTFVQTVKVENPMLWHPDHPHLYKAITTVYHGMEAADTYETVFGIRTIKFTRDQGFFINGKPLLIKGVCVHQDFAGVGAALPDRINAYKVELLKEMGANAYRCAHHPPTPELLDACDRLGIMVMDENRKLDSSPEGIRNLKSMLYRDRNHPSIILWSMENEEELEGTKMGARILDTLARTTRKLDPTRPVLAAMNHSFNKGGYSDRVDIVGYNYGAYDNNRDIRDHLEYPERMMIGSENASYTTTRGIYHNDDELGYCSEYGTKLAAWCCSAEKAWQDVINYPFLTGVFMWTGFDYKGEPTPYNWPAIGSHFGIMDSCGFPKHIYYYFKSAWTDVATVHLMPHWNWPGSEGQEIDVRVFSNCETVELVLNGRTLGAKKAERNAHLEWKVGYEPGTIIAIGRNGSEEAARHTVTTAGAPYAIKLEADRADLQSDGSDVSMIRVTVVDADGNIVPTADNLIRFSVEGPGKLIGVGNGDPSSHESDKTPYRRTFNGHCLAMIQSEDDPGEIIVRAQSIGLRGTEATLAARAEQR